jgi:hypothetical protein
VKFTSKTHMGYTADKNHPYFDSPKGCVLCKLDRGAGIHNRPFVVASGDDLKPIVERL